MTVCGERKQETRARAWIRSKDWEKIQGSSASSISKLRRRSVLERWRTESYNCVGSVKRNVYVNMGVYGREFVADDEKGGARGCLTCSSVVRYRIAVSSWALRYSLERGLTSLAVLDSSPFLLHVLKGYA